MSKRAAQAAFVFQYFLDHSFGTDGSGNHRSTVLEATTSFDAGTDFAVAFGEAFPGRVPDGNHKNASARLSRVLRSLAADRWLERGRLGNEGDGLAAMPKWQYVYSLPQWLINDLKMGYTTPEKVGQQVVEGRYRLD